MARELFEFFCSGGCSGYFRTRLRTNIDGDYIIVCPKCGHEHLRKIKGGQITGDRHGTTEEKGAQRICVPLSAYSEKPQVEHPKDGTKGSDDAVVVGLKTKRQLLWDRFIGRQERGGE